MKRRVRVLPAGYLVGTKGHSVLRKKTYVRKPLVEVEEFYSPTMPVSRRHEFDSGYSIGTFHDARNFSNAVMDDTYDLQAQSRGRDHRLLSSMNSALHTDSPPTSPLLSSRSSKPRNSSQIQHKPRRSTKLDTYEPLKTSKYDSLKTSKLSDSLKTSKYDSLKTSKLSDSLKTSKYDSPKTSKLSDSLKTSKYDSPKTSKLSDSLKTSKYDSPKTSKLSDSLKTSKYDSLKTPKLSDSLKKTKPFGSLKLSKISDSLRISEPKDSIKISKPSESLQLSKYEPRKKTKPSESLQMVKFAEPLEIKKGTIAGIDRMSPVVEQARGLLNRQRTFGLNSDLDSIATTAITAPRDLKSDFFSISPLTNYIKNRWPEQELPIPVSIEEVPRPKKDLYKNPYLESSDDEDYEPIVLKPKERKTGDVLKALREKKASNHKAVELDSEDEDSAKGAYAIKYVDSEDEEIVEKPVRSKKYEIDDSPNEMAMSHLVSAAALRARAVLENLTGLYGKGGLVNVEGDIRPYGGELTTFRLHTPFHFQGPLMVGEKPALSVGDDSFERYMVGLQEKRKEERNKVEKDARRMSKLTRSLTNEPPKQYSLRPVGYINDDSYESFSKSLVPYKTKFDKTLISSSRKKVHFGEDDEEEVVKKPTVKLSRELVPCAPKGIEDEEMALVPRRRYPVYEYTEDIPIKLSIEVQHPDGEHTERLSVLEKIRIKALLVGEDKLDDPDRPRIRKPRSRYYADKLQKMDNQEHLSSLMATPPTNHAISVKASSAPRKPVHSYTWRPIREVDGYTYTTPAHLMSWQYRLDSHLDAEDLISKPSNYGKMRDQVRGVQDKLDHHRQLMDRYPVTDFDADVDVGVGLGLDFDVDPLAYKKKADLGERITLHADRVGADTTGLGAGGSLSAGRTTDEGAGGDGLGTVSPLRKKLRKVICKSRHDPSYYDD